MMNTLTLIYTVIGVVFLAAGIFAMVYAAGNTSIRIPRRENRITNKQTPSANQVVQPVVVPVVEAVPVPKPSETVSDLEQAPAPVDNKIFNIPHARNFQFFGRQKILEDLRSALMSDQTAALVEPVRGLGGVGKTQIAVEYAYRYAETYESIWWIRAARPATMHADFVALASKLKLRLEDARTEVILEAVLHALSISDRWLLVFDDAQDPDSIIRWIPKGGHVIITSREPDWWSACTPLFVKELDRIEATDLMFNRTLQANGATVAQMAGLLQDLPLVLIHARAYLSRTGQSTAEYLSLCRSQRRQIASHVLDSVDRQEVAAVTLSVSMQRIMKELGAAGDLLSLLSFMAPEAIPISLIRDGAEHLPGHNLGALSNPNVFSSAMEVLERYALLEPNDDSIAFVHRLVQLAVRSRLSEADKQKWCSAAVNLVESVFDCDSRDSRALQTCSQLLPHALAAIEHAEELGVVAEKVSSLVQDVAIYLRTRGDLLGARKMSEKSLALAEVTFGSGHPRVAMCADNLGSTLQQLGDLPAAQIHYERALKIDENAYGANHPNVASRLGSLGDSLCAQGNALEARPYLERALKIAENAYGVNHANVSGRAASLAQALEQLGELKVAKELLERALKIDETSFGPMHANIALRAHSLGQVMYKLNDLAKARVHYDRALKIEELIHGHDHPLVAMRVTNVGQLLEGECDLMGARDCYEEALAINEAVYGPSSPKVVASIDSLCRIVQRMGDIRSVRDFHRKTLAIYEAAYGLEHPDVAKRAVLLGDVLVSGDDLSGAREQYERALEIHQAAYGVTHIEVANDLIKLGQVMNTLGDNKTSRMQLGRALLIFHDQLGPSHPETQQIQRNLATQLY